MSRRCIGYEGEGRRRRPIYSDEGPAAAGAVSGLAAMGRLSALQIKETAGDIEFGAGQVERRQITADEDAARREVEDRPSPIAPVRPAMGSPEHLQQSRMRGAVRHQEVMAERVLATVTGPTVSAHTLEEELPMEAAAAATDPLDELPNAPDVEDLGATLAFLTDAARIAQEAWMRLQASRQQVDELEAIWTKAREALEASWLATWVGFRTPLPDDVLPPPEELARVAEQRHEQLLNGDRPDPSTADPQPSDVDEDEPDDAPAVVTRPAAGGGPGATKQERILAAVVQFGGDLRAVAADRNTTPGNVVATLHNAGKSRRLTPEIIALLPASFAKYSVVGR